MNKKYFKTKSWHTLDNTAKIFPVISSKKSSNVFRISVVLNNNINQDLLQKALDTTLPWFKVFQVKLKRGFFWHYFETNTKQAKVSKEHKYPCQYINFKSSDRYLFNVSYYENRINLEVFHALTDGTGAIDFLKALTYNYIKIINNTLDENLIPDNDLSLSIEDSYIKNYEAKPLNLGKDCKAFQVKDKKLPLPVVSVIHGHINVDTLISFCRKQDITITEYVTSVFIWAIYKEYQMNTNSKKPIKILIPVNLRKYFESDTTMNFFSSITINVNFFQKSLNFDMVLKKVKEQFKIQLTKDNLSKKIANNVYTEKNLLIRLVPLFIKKIGVKIGYLKVKHSNTTTLSNLGKVDITKEYQEEIVNFNAVLAPSTEEPIKCSLISCNNDLVITFSSILENTYIERSFFRHLTADEINVKIESNGVYNEDL